MVRNINNNKRASAEAAVTLPILTKEADFRSCFSFFFPFFLKGFQVRYQLSGLRPCSGLIFRGFFLKDFQVKRQLSGLRSCCCLLGVLLCFKPYSTRLSASAMTSLIHYLLDAIFLRFFSLNHSYYFFQFSLCTERNN